MTHIDKGPPVYGYSHEEARRRCDSDSKVVSAGPVKADGVFIDGPSISDPLLLAAKLIGEQRLAFVEFNRLTAKAMKGPKQSQNPASFYFNERFIERDLDEPYVRLFPAQRDDPRCAYFNWTMQQSPFQQPSMRWAGFTPEVCIGLERITESKAEVEQLFAFDELPSRVTSNTSGWFRLQERKTKRELGRVWTHWSCPASLVSPQLLALLEGPGTPIVGPLPSPRVDVSPIFPRREKARVVLGPEVPDPQAATSTDMGRVVARDVIDDGMTSVGSLLGNVQSARTLVRKQGLWVVRQGLRRNVALLDGQHVFESCFSVVRQGSMVVVQCAGRWIDAKQYERKPWFLYFADDGAPIKTLEIDLGANDGLRFLHHIELEDGIPKRGVLSISATAAIGSARTHHQAFIELAQ